MSVIIKNKIENTPNNFSFALKRFGAACGLCLGFILLITGIILSCFAFLEKTNFDTTEIILIVTSFVLFGCGAHCLDLLEKEKQAKRGIL